MCLLKRIQADQLQVAIYKTRDAMGQAAGQTALSIIRRLLAEKEEVNIIFAAAPSQNEILQTLTQAKDLEWNRVNAFHMDEYLGLPTEAPQGFGNFLTERLFRHLPFKNVFLIDSSATKAEEECTRYTALLQKYPVDLVCLGIGENGHIAFNDPGVADFEDPYLVKTAQLDLVCRMQQVHDGCFAALEDVPAQALTLTVPALTAASHFICTVPAKSKAQAVTLSVTGPITPDVPASIMRRHPNALLFCDADSGAGLL